MALENRLASLLEKNRLKACSVEELQELYNILAKGSDAEVDPPLLAFYEKMDAGNDLKDIDWDYVYDQIIQSQAGKTESLQRRPELLVAEKNTELINNQQVHNQAFPNRSLRKYWAAASILVVVIAAWYFISTRPDSPQKQHEIVKTEEVPNIKAGTDGAILTLADGSTIVLDSMGNGPIPQQGNRNVQFENGQLDYTISTAGKDQLEERILSYNTLITPRGRQVRLILPDGSKVWLNAASSIKYPTNFERGARSVEITGEAYFSVVANANQPFIVKSNNQEVKVLGTEFNINAYDNEIAAFTTLVDGSVQISKAGEATGQLNAVILKPGQQSVVDKKPSHNPIKVMTVDLEPEIAWKDGLFNFKSTDIQTMMRQLERWYDVEVVYPKGIPPDKFGGKISRNVDLQHLLEILKHSDIKVKIEGKTVIITP